MRHSQSVHELFDTGKGAKVSGNEMNKQNEYVLSLMRERDQCLKVIFTFRPLQILTQSRTGKRTPMYFSRPALDSVISSKGSLILLNGPNAIEVHKVYISMRKIHSFSFFDCTCTVA